MCPNIEKCNLSFSQKRLQVSDRSHTSKLIGHTGQNSNAFIVQILSQICEEKAFIIFAYIIVLQNNIFIVNSKLLETLIMGSLTYEPESFFFTFDWILNFSAYFPISLDLDSRIGQTSHRQPCHRRFTCLFLSLPVFSSRKYHKFFNQNCIQ